MKDTTPSSRLFVVAGEASGDTIAASVVTALKRDHPQLGIFGAGGSKLRVAGQNQCLDLVSHAIMGAAEVLLKLPKYFGFFKKILTEIERTRPDALLLVDYPGLNLRLAKAVRQKFPAIKIIYLVAPKAWAWRPSRAKIVEKYVDLLIPVFSFEAQWYRANCPKLKVEYVGHPMVDTLAEVSVPSHRDRNTLALFPGSRRREIQHILPTMLDALPSIMSRTIIDKIRIAAPHDTAAAQARKILTHDKYHTIKASCEIVTGMSQEVAALASVGVVKSGTITAECAYLGLPHVVVYKTSLLEALLMGIFVRVRYFSLVNLIAGKPVVTELAQFHVTGSKIALETVKLLNNLKARNQQHTELLVVRERMGAPGAAARVAELIGNFVKPRELALF
ncbi:lipid-A-disaccharide synthase [Kamptonema cortianum]|nr:lipid-A-disaccharide synthase [Oscillatoria laete-virens]MDK3160261.1 lipid-A-disaccharide synthase [Kamptonema cortianum]MDL5048387.1 lipid-A-disaccharide synthase [Oscillatoria amoena NRMC-F 0135]MDL5054248.1 lipid-A-disaccharide synthase [Oscillatoria laete-virens NRMC-F 0139]